MAENIFDKRRKALEETFYAKMNNDLLDKLKQDLDQKEQKEQLAASSGITSDELLDRLIARGIQAPTWAAISLVPLVEVAWADGKIEAQEREAILKAAAQSGLELDSPSYVLLQEWLNQPPDSDLRETWKQYVSELAKDADPEAKPKFREAILGRAQAVAEAAGGFLGMGSKISAAEQQVLDDLESAMM